MFGLVIAKTIFGHSWLDLALVVELTFTQLGPWLLTWSYKDLENGKCFETLEILIKEIVGEALRILGKV